VAAHLREELLRGALSDPLPGVHALTAELGANHNTVHKALRLLEQEGVLLAQGPGRRRRIAVAEGKVARPLRLALPSIHPRWSWPRVTWRICCTG
jgi:DNA-binding transcriptional regulator YhcF (GntR family)